MIQDEQFPKTQPGLLGTHSARKFPATYARRNGCSRDDVDVRGRWKNKKRQVDTYIDVVLPYPDAKVASTLCIGGPVKYEIRRGSGVSDQWLFDNVCTQIGRHFPRGVGLVLGRALLWAIFDEKITKLIDDEMVARVKAAVLRLNSNLPVGLNPIKKVPLIVIGDDDSLVISEMDDGDDDEVDNDGNGGTNNGDGPPGEDAAARRRRIRVGENETSLQVRVLSQSVKQLRRQNDELKNEIHLFKQSTNTLLSNLNASIRRLAMVPVMTPRRRIGGRGTAPPVSPLVENEFGGVIGGVDDDDDDDDGGDGDDGDDGVVAARPLLRSRRNRPSIPYATTLCKCPKTLHVLWTEYEFGIGGRKAAKLFNASERGRVQFNYSLRKPFWDLVLTMARRGYTHNTAIDKIYSVYSSRMSVTRILREIRNDKKRGGHPELV